MAREMMYGDAIAAAIIEEMQRDPEVIFYGQNMAMTERDPMLRKFGKDRVRLAPISETASSRPGWPRPRRSSAPRPMSSPRSRSPCGSARSVPMSASWSNSPTRRWDVPSNG